MSRLPKIVSFTILTLFILACATVTQPIKDVQNIAGTAESFATALPIETLKAVASQIPVETLEALPSVMPDIQGYFNPQGTPVSEWDGIPVMPQATAGQEFTDTHTYSFKADTTVKEAQDFYKAHLTDLGWSSFFNVPGSDSGGAQIFQKDNSVLTVTIVDVNGSVVVVLTKP